MSRKKSNKSLYSSLISVIAVALALIIYFIGGAVSDKVQEDKTDAPLKAKGELIVHFIDVGQGDSEFIELPDGKCMLIDAGTNENGAKIISEIKGLGYSTIDYLVATHPHSDHIGGMGEVVNAFEIKNVYMPRVSTTTKTYEKLLSAISEKGVKITSAKAGKIIIDTDDVKAQILSPSSDSYEELNNYSCVIRLTYNSSSFLFTGDAQSEVEKQMLSGYYQYLDCDVLKVAHHGSRYSSTKNFLSAVTPEIAVISCGVGNSYNHPHSQALDRLNKTGTQIYRTDKLGDITIITTGDGHYEVDY